MKAREIYSAARYGTIFQLDVHLDIDERLIGKGKEGVIFLYSVG